MKYYRQYLKTVTVMLVLTTMFISGCVGSALRSGMTEDKEYKEFIKQAPVIAKGYGRIIIYSPKGGPSYPLNSMGDIEFFTIDRKVYRFGGASYFYLDIKSGQHQLTVNNVLIRGFASNKKQYGKYKLELNVPEQDTIYLRFVNQSKSKAIDERAYSVDIVDKESAGSEMANLRYWNNFNTTMTIAE
ncbi:MAG: hypothetical protein ACPG52_13515 [Cognaticolwellia sp.]